MITTRTINTLKDYCTSYLNHRQIERLFQDNGFRADFTLRQFALSKADYFESYLISFETLGSEQSRLALFAEAIDILYKNNDSHVFDEGHIGTNLKNELIRLLKNDGYEYIENKFIKIDASIQTIEPSTLNTLTKNYSDLRDNNVKSPEKKIGLSKDLLESIFKVICESNGIHYEKDEKFDALAKKALTNVELVLCDCTEKEKTTEYIRQIIQIVSLKINEIRNIHGYGHGKNSEYKPIDLESATLISNLALTIGTFFIPRLDNKGSS